MRVRLLFAAPARLSYGSNMLPDLRFVIGAVLATVVLGVTALGLISSIRLAHESRTAPLEATRPLAYTAPTGLATQAVRPGDVAQQPGGPFEKVPAGGTVTAQAPAAPEPDAPAAESTPATADDHAAVDERAVVDPPLSPEGEPLPSEAQNTTTAPAIPEPSVPAAAAVAPPSDIIEPSAADTTGSIPAASVAPETKRTPAAKAKKAKPAVRKTAAKPTQRARPGNVIAPTASTGYPVTIERTPNAGARNKGGGFPFGD